MLQLITDGPPRGAALKGAAKIGAKFAVMVALLGGLYLFAYYHRYTQTGPHRRAYEGRVIDKWQMIRETQLGSRVRQRVLVEADGGERFEVSVNGETYERAQPGMRIRNGTAGVELWWPVAAAGLE